MKSILEIRDVVIRYETDGSIVQAVNGVSLNLAIGETLGLVGETGAGKTTLAKCIMGLLPKPPAIVGGGCIEYENNNLLELDETKMRGIRGAHISMIFQDPMTSLNPVLTVRDQIAEVVSQHTDLSNENSIKKAEEMLELVGIPHNRGSDYPHQFSGGMKQRVIIAIALACNPKLLIADEPTTALDVTIQAQVLEMMKELKRKLNTSMLLITHDLGVVAQCCDNVAIMYAGQIVEYGSLYEVFKEHRHPYTSGLLSSVPNLKQDVERLRPIPGLMPDPSNLPKGCPFHPRCHVALGLCKDKMPPANRLSEESLHMVRCWRSTGSRVMEKE